jgi:hypothetical protein
VLPGSIRVVFSHDMVAAGQVRIGSNFDLLRTSDHYASTGCKTSQHFGGDFTSLWRIALCLFRNTSAAMDVGLCLGRFIRRWNLDGDAAAPRHISPS